MVHDEQIDRSEAREKARRWAESHHALAVYMRDHKTPKEHARLNAQAALVSDLRDELARAAQDAHLDAKSFGTWLEVELPTELPRMPYLGHLNEILFERLRNADDKWQANDLVDMHYLSCAAGYADVVVGEKKTSALLQRAGRRLGHGAHISRTLTEAVAHLDDVLPHAPRLPAPR